MGIVQDNLTTASKASGQMNRLRNGMGRMTLESLDQAVKAAIMFISLIPLMILCEQWLRQELGANPVETLTNETGLWSLRLFWVVLVVTPLRKWLGWFWLVTIRRQIALTSFLYGCLHLLIYMVFEMEFDWGEMITDIGKRPFILAGVLGLAIMIPLAITSTNGMIKRLGGKNWKRLHRLTYVAAILVAMHYLLLVKQDITNPGIYILLLAVMFMARLEDKKKRRPISTPQP